MSRMLTHGRCGPLAGRLERLVSQAKAECRLAELSARCRLRETATSRGEKPTLCRECGIPLLPTETDICRHCAAGRLNGEGI